MIQYRLRLAVEHVDGLLFVPMDDWQEQALFDSITEAQWEAIEERLIQAHSRQLLVEIQEALG